MTAFRIVLGIIATMALGAPADARLLEVGPGKPYAKPSEAAAAARDGDRILIAAGEYYDCAVWTADNLVIEGVSAAGTVITDTTCQGKALFVVTGNDAVVRNLTLARARVPDGNGAGIRVEGRNILVERVRFVHNENGVLTTFSQPQGTLLIRDSEFVGNGPAHAVYAGQWGLVRVERSTFRETRRGHHIKSRAFRTEVLDCDIADGPAGTASYLIDVPNGGGVLVRGNRLEKGPRAENRRAAISIGAEGVNRPTPEILVEDNAFTNDGQYQTTFVVNITATPAMLRRNRLVGQVQPLRGDGSVEPAPQR